MKNAIIWIWWLGIFLPLSLASAVQEDSSPQAKGQTKTVVPGSRYEAGGLHRFFFGAHWRDAWSTPIDVEVLDLGNFAGGLTPTKRGGGYQTKSLRFKGNDGKGYKFRSIDKDPAKVLPPELRESIAADVLQDQISSSNPFAAVVVAPLLNAAGVLNAQPRIVLLPDDERLREFRQDFGGILGTLEENPDEGFDSGEDAGKAEKVINTFKLFERLEEDRDHHVDARAYLKARLMDIFLGDWDRHHDQWQWAGFKESDQWYWKPIPRDRDQAFCRLDGLFPSLATEYVMQLKSFSDDYPDIDGLTWSGRHLDRRLLTSLGKSVWDSIAVNLTQRLTDSVISIAARQMPPSFYEKEGKELEMSLIHRRSLLPKATEEFYHECARFVDLYGTKKDELVEIHSFGNNQMSVRMYKRKGSGETGDLLYDRTFSDDETKEIRLHLLDGDDEVKLVGDNGASIGIIVDGGEGEDHVGQQSDICVTMYDSGKTTSITGKRSVVHNQENYSQPSTDEERYIPLQRDYGHSWMFIPSLGVNPDEGVFLGGTQILTDYAYRVSPYNYQIAFGGGAATRLWKYKGSVLMDSYSIIKGVKASLNLRASQLERLNFFGFGNESQRSSPGPDEGDYYKVFQEHYSIQPAIEIPLTAHGNFKIGTSLDVVMTDFRSNTFIDLAKPYGAGEGFTYLSFLGGVHFDGRNSAIVPTSGVFLSLQGKYAPAVFNTDKSFGNIGADIRTYLSPDSAGSVTLALRAAGKKIWGTFPYFESAFLGGSGSIRGYDAERFAGDAMVLGNAELRVHIAKISFLFPGRFGILGFAETGRVFLDAEESTQWHAAVGGGIWCSFVKDLFGFSISVARSPEKTGLYAQGGFFF